MLKTMIQILKLTAALHTNDWCQVDQVENGVASVVCNGNAGAFTVDAGLVGPEGTDYGAIEYVRIVRTNDDGADIKL